MHSFTLHLEGERESLVEAQVVQAQIGMSLSNVFEEIYDSKLDGRLRTEMLIVRLPVHENWDPQELLTKGSERSQQLFAAPEADPNTAFDRARDRSIHILTSHNGQFVLTPNLNPYWATDPLVNYGIEVNRALDAIQKAEFEYILERSRAVLISPPESFLRAPSGRLVKSFIRVGNIQYDRDAIDAVFFWMLPRLSDVGAILTDTWSISSIAFNIAGRCASYFGGAQRPVEMLPIYNDGSEEVQSRTRKVIERLDSDHAVAQLGLRTMLCIVSATHTGSLINHLEMIFKSSSLHLQPRIIALFALGDASIERLHDLSGDPRFALPEEQSAQRGEAIAIDPQVYFPLSFKDTVIEVNKAVADRSRAFFDRYVGRGVIEVHRTHEEGTGRPRHHAIHLATERLMEVPEFMAALETRLSELPSEPAMIVSPPHEPGRALARQVQCYFSNKGFSCPVFEHPNFYFKPNYLSPEEATIREFLRTASDDKALLVIDDVCITGTRLSQYQRYIRSQEFRGRIDFVVGIARPSHLNIWRNLQRYLSHRNSGGSSHTVQCVDFVLLPDWRDEDCPWCSEKRLYERWPKQNMPDFLIRRLQELSFESRSGLTNGLFLEIIGLPPLTLGPGSFFTRQDANQSEVFAAVAAALQWLRTTSSPSGPPLGPRRFPLSTVLNHVDYLRSKWTDSILRASFLRGAAIEELTYADENREAERTKVLADLLTQRADGEHDIALEVLLASSLGKCRIHSADDSLARSIAEFGAGEVSSYMLERLKEDRR